MEPSLERQLSGDPLGCRGAAADRGAFGGTGEHSATRFASPLRPAISGRARLAERSNPSGRTREKPAKTAAPIQHKRHYRTLLIGEKPAPKYPRRLLARLPGHRQLAARAVAKLKPTATPARLAPLRGPDGDRLRPPVRRLPKTVPCGGTSRSAHPAARRDPGTRVLPAYWTGTSSAASPFGDDRGARRRAAR